MTFENINSIWQTIRNYQNYETSTIAATNTPTQISSRRTSLFVAHEVVEVDDAVEIVQLVQVLHSLGAGHGRGRHGTRITTQT